VIQVPVSDQASHFIFLLHRLRTPRQLNLTLCLRCRLVAPFLLLHRRTRDLESPTRLRSRLLLHRLPRISILFALRLFNESPIQTHTQHPPPPNIPNLALPILPPNFPPLLRLHRHRPLHPIKRHPPRPPLLPSLKPPRPNLMRNTHRTIPIPQLPCLLIHIHPIQRRRLIRDIRDEPQLHGRACGVRVRDVEAREGEGVDGRGKGDVELLVAEHDAAGVDLGTLAARGVAVAGEGEFAHLLGVGGGGFVFVAGGDAFGDADGGGEGREGEEAEDHGGGCVRKYIYVYVRVYMQEEKKDDLLYTCESVRSTESGTWGRRGSRQSPLA